MQTSARPLAGDARIAVLQTATGAELDAFLKANVAAQSHLLTDGFAGYRGCDGDLGEYLGPHAGRPGHRR